MTQNLQAQGTYTALITRQTPTAFIFLIDQSGSMSDTTQYNGKTMSKAEAVARIVNHQLGELVMRCVKGDETRDYYDIAVIGYGDDARSAWQGELAGRDFVRPSELQDHPCRTITTRQETHTPKGTRVVETEEEQWVEASSNGGCTYVEHALRKARELLEGWIGAHGGDYCYPPTVINITDGMFNGAPEEEVKGLAEELMRMTTQDGNVILFNIHITADKDAQEVFCPADRQEVEGDDLAATLYDMSSLLPERYSEGIADCRGEAPSGKRYVAMSAKVGMERLAQLMDIGTPTNISQSNP